MSEDLPRFRLNPSGDRPQRRFVETPQIRPRPPQSPIHQQETAQPVNYPSNAEVGSTFGQPQMPSSSSSGTLQDLPKVRPLKEMGPSTFSPYTNTPQEAQPLPSQPYQNPKMASTEQIIEQAQVKTKKSPKSKKLKVLSAVGLVVLVALGSGLYSYKSYTDKTKASSQQNVAKNPLTPGGKPKLAVGQALGSAYDPKSGVSSYIDDYQGANITVSQQPLPANFKQDKDALKKLASSLGANRTVKTTKGLAYIATDTKLFKQTVIIGTSDRLLFITSERSLLDTAWVKYIDALVVK